MERFARPAFLLLVVGSLSTGFLLPDSPLRHLGEPAFGAALGLSVLLLALVALHLLGRAGSRIEQGVFAVFLGCMPLVYVNSCIRGGGGVTWLGVEIAGQALFAAMAILGFTRKAWLLPVGIIAHALLWDAWHHPVTAYIPGWYVAACLIVDVSFGLYAATQVRRWQAAIAR